MELQTTDLERNVNGTGDNGIKNNKHGKKIQHKRSNRQKWRVDKIQILPISQIRTQI